MNIKKYNLSELKSSVIQYDKEPPKFIRIIIIVVLLFLATVIGLSCYFKKTEVVTSSGTVEASDKTYVLSSVQAEVSTVEVSEGDYVDEGATLAVLDSTEVSGEAEMYGSQADYYQTIMGYYQEMITGLNNYNTDDTSSNTNPFDEDTEEYYYDTYQDALDAIAEEDSADDMEDQCDSYISNFYYYYNQYEQYYTQYASEEEYYEGLIAMYTITASTSGYVHFENTISSGIVVSVGTSMFSLSSEITSDNNEISLYVSASSRSNISVGDSVEVVVSGALQSIYGTLNGSITEIANDSYTDSDSGSVYYLVTIVLDSTTLTSKSGNEIDVTNGMSVSVIITYDQSTWFNWALKKIGIIDN